MIKVRSDLPMWEAESSVSGNSVAAEYDRDWHGAISLAVLGDSTIGGGRC